MPQREPMVMCFGKPVETKQVNVPVPSDGKKTAKATKSKAGGAKNTNKVVDSTQEFDAEVDRCFELYKKGIEEVYEFYKNDMVGYEGRELEIMG